MKKSWIVAILGIAIAYLGYKVFAKKTGNQYRVIKEILAGSGYIHDKDGNAVSMQSLAPKVGDIITGEIKETYLFNQKMIGITYPIKLGEGIENQTKLFIPEENLQAI